MPAQFCHASPARPQGSISGRDFAHSVVSCARLKHVDLYLDKTQVCGAGLAVASKEGRLPCGADLGSLPGH